VAILRDYFLALDFDLREYRLASAWEGAVVAVNFGDGSFSRVNDGA